MLPFQIQNWHELEVEPGMGTATQHAHTQKYANSTNTGYMCTISYNIPIIHTHEYIHMHTNTASTHTCISMHTHMHTRTAYLVCDPANVSHRVDVISILNKGRVSLLPCRVVHSSTHQCWAHTSATVTNYMHTGRRRTSGCVTPHGTDPTLPLLNRPACTPPCVPT